MEIKNYYYEEIEDCKGVINELNKQIEFIKETFPLAFEEGNAENCLDTLAVVKKKILQLEGTTFLGDLMKVEEKMQELFLRAMEGDVKPYDPLRKKETRKDYLELGWTEEELDRMIASMMR